MDSKAGKDSAVKRAVRGRRRVSIADIARASSVSSAVVSYVINDGPRPVHPETRARVLKAMRDLNYRPSAVVSGASAHSMSTIGIAFPKPDPSLVVSPFYSTVQLGIVEEALRRGQNTLVYSGCFDTDVHKNLRIYADGRCDGLILITPPMDSKLVPALKERGIPFVQLLDSHEDPEAPTIDVDDAQGASDMTTYLLSLGHKRIAYFAGDDNLAATPLRVGGYQSAMREAGVADEYHLVKQGHYSRQSGYDLARDVMALPLDTRPTALFCSNDDSAIGALDALRELGINVPGDISVVGTDDIPQAAFTEPPLTTVRQPLQEWGRRAVSMLMDVIDGIDSERRIMLPSSVIVRQSAAPPKG
ncbi:MAG TPA: LacI family DNA-binding transcriptional regulator [Capsulimonadaceae bacterium]|jgi:LacI family transcriptional regulator